MWHVKYRPTRFEEVVGNRRAIRLLKRLGNSARAVLIYGRSGCGKTTLGRVFANEIGAVVYEYNVANTRGIETIRNVVELCRYREVSGRRRVFLFDEAHQLTVDAQNALLKELESENDVNVFVLATTEPDKVIETVRNRCVVVEVERLSVSEMYELVKRITEKEGVVFSDDVLMFVYKRNKGVPRGILMDLYVVRDVGMDLKEVKRLLRRQESGLEKEEFTNFCGLIVDGRVEWSVLRRYVEDLKEEDVGRFVEFCKSYLLSVVLRRDLVDGEEMRFYRDVLEVFDEVRDKFELVARLLGFCSRYSRKIKW